MRVSAACLLVLAALAAWTGAASAQPRQLPALAPAANDGLKRALTQGRLTEAQYALERARSLFRLGAVRREFGDVERPGPRDATLILRDLAVRLRELSGTERREAERILARPDMGGVPPGTGDGWTADEATLSPLCGADVALDANVCVHWVDEVGDPDAPPAVDTAPASGYPDQVDATLAELETVWDKEIGELGYRAPQDDSDSPNGAGGGPELDVYLDNIGTPDLRLFGYCTTDDPDAEDPFVFAFSAYCVLDNDYSAVEFGLPPEEHAFLKVTAAHEFHHASQFAYDGVEDLWFMEGTATNMEETVYPTVDDNVNFLDFSPLTRPASPLDRGGFGDSEYGSWIFWRFLEEKLYRGDPNVIRRVWNRARAALPTDPDEYSIQAVARVLRHDGIHLADAFVGFAVANRLRTYADSNLYPRTPTDRTFRIGPAQRRTAWQARRMKHLTTRYFSFRPRSGVPRRARLGLNVEAHPRGGRARVIIFTKGGSRSIRFIRLDRQGDGHRRVPFGRDVRRVDLVLSNGSSRMRDCFSDFFEPFYSCSGVPKDDRRTYRFRAILRT
ncbi:MAG: MXAN_6640 family putative metalloprotease [Thermoleophilaceae bacterium]